MSGLRLTDVRHTYGVAPVLKNVSLDVAPGALVTLVGPSGCGKTTLLRIAAGLEPLQAGSVSIDGVAVSDATTGLHVPPERRNVGLMFQDYALFPHLTVRDNVLFGVPRGATDRRAWLESSMARMGLTPLAANYPHRLSGGEQQRVALLRAIAPGPKVLLLDEPFSGLDVTLRTHVREETLDLLKETGIATLMVTHDPEEAMFMADRILVMNNGAVIQAGSPVDIYFRPASAFVAAFFGPVNRLHGVVRAGRVETLVGTVAAPNFRDGAAVEVLLRPEGLKLTVVPNDAPAPDPRPHLRVAWARSLGRSSLVRLDIPGGRDPAFLQARVFGSFLPEAGTAVTVEVDDTRAFVFAAGAPGN
ncbi:MAG: ABC transporter ATP-binding protein [Rhodospirillales bacterium]|nr:ABC transporter ATP-binding protein [Rhodospirillales bacterium]